MGLSQEFKNALRKYLYKQGCTNVFTIESWEDYTESGGYCETCYYETTKCKVRYLDEDGNPHEYNYYGTFSELLEGLLSESE